MAQEIEHRSLAGKVELREVADNPHGGFAGYANLTGIVDEYESVFAPGCYQELDALVRDGFIGEGHDWGSLGAGYFIEAREDAKGLYISAIFHGDAESQALRQKVQERLAAGKTVALSIGFYTLESNVEQRDGRDVRVINKCVVKEVSLVAVPGTPGSQVSEARGMTFAQEYDAVRDAVQGLTQRCGKIAELRETLSPEKQTQIVTLADAFDAASAELRGLVQTVDAPDEAELLELRKMFQEIA